MNKKKEPHIGYVCTACGFPVNDHHWEFAVGRLRRERDKERKVLNDINTVLSFGANPEWDDNKRILEAGKILAKWVDKL